MSKAKIYTAFKGTDKEFSGKFKDVCNHFGFKDATIARRMKENNMTLDEALSTNLKLNNIETVFKNTDEEFSGTRKEICEHFNIKYHVIQNILNKSNDKENLTFIEAFENYYNSNYFIIFKDTNNEFSGFLKDIAKNYNTSVPKLKKYLNELNNIDLVILKIIEENEIENKRNKYNQENHTVLGFTGTRNDIYKHFNLNRSNVQNRIRKFNETFEKACEFYIKNGNIKSKDNNYYTVLGFTGRKGEIIKYYSLNWSSINNLIKHYNHTFESACEYCIKNNIKKKNGPNIYTVMGFSGLQKDICKYFKISQYLVRKLSKENNWTFEGACNYLIKYKDDYNKESIKSICDKNYKDYNKIMNLINKHGYSIEEALELPTEIIIMNKVYKYKNKNFNNLREFCKYYNKDFIEVYNMLKHNYTLDYIINNTHKEYKDKEE